MLQTSRRAPPAHSTGYHNAICASSFESLGRNLYESVSARPGVPVETIYRDAERLLPPVKMTDQAMKPHTKAVTRFLAHVQILLGSLSYAHESGYATVELIFICFNHFKFDS